MSKLGDSLSTFRLPVIPGSRLVPMQLTSSYEDALPAEVLSRYEFAEVRNAAAVLAASNPDEFAEVVGVLSRFKLTARDLLLPGGNEGLVAKELNAAFRTLGWREARVDTLLKHSLVIFPFSGAGERKKQIVETSAEFEGYKADWVKHRVAGDTEWNAKDGNLDRNLASYRSLYEAGFIDGAVLVTRTIDDLKMLEQSLVDEMLATDPLVSGASLQASPKTIDDVLKRLQKPDTKLRLGTATTTNLPKLEHRLRRGDSGGCPVLAVAICAKTHDGSRVAPAQ